MELLPSFMLNTREFPCAFIVTRLVSLPSIVRFLSITSSPLVRLIVPPSILLAKVIVSPVPAKLIASRRELAP